MPTQIPRIVRKEVLPCRCIRYVYETGVDILYCTNHSRFIKANGRQPAVAILLDQLYHEPAFVPKPHSRFWKYARRTAVVTGVLSIVGFFLFSTPDIAPSHKRIAPASTYRSFDDPLFLPPPNRELFPFDRQFGMSRWPTTPNGRNELTFGGPNRYSETPVLKAR